MWYISLNETTTGDDTTETKRKTHTSSEVKKRYIDKTYTRYTLNLRKVEDADLIIRIEKEKASGLSTTEAIKKLIK
jgi:hypothetical protein